jgi:phage terminase large subunit-like protein
MIRRVLLQILTHTDGARNLACNPSGVRIKTCSLSLCITLRPLRRICRWQVQGNLDRSVFALYQRDVMERFMKIRWQRIAKLVAGVDVHAEAAQDHVGTGIEDMLGSDRAMPFVVFSKER